MTPNIADMPVNAAKDEIAKRVAIPDDVAKELERLFDEKIAETLKAAMPSYAQPGIGLSTCGKDRVEVSPEYRRSQLLYCIGELDRIRQDLRSIDMKDISNIVAEAQSSAFQRWYDLDEDD